MPSRKLLPRVSQTWLVVTAMTLLAYWSRSSFGMGVLLFLAAWLLFMLNEGSYFHSAQEHENRFTLCMGVYAARVAFFTADSPLAFVGRHSPTLGYFLMGAIGYWFCQWNRVAHRQQLAIEERDIPFLLLRREGFRRRTGPEEGHNGAT